MFWHCFYLLLWLHCAPSTYSSYYLKWIKDGWQKLHLPHTHEARLHHPGYISVKVLVQKAIVMPQIVFDKLKVNMNLTLSMFPSDALVTQSNDTDTFWANNTLSNHESEGKLLHSNDIDVFYFLSKFDVCKHQQMCLLYSTFSVRGFSNDQVLEQTDMI